MQAGLAAFKAAMEASMPALSKLLTWSSMQLRRSSSTFLPHPEWTEVIQLRTDKLLRMENPQSSAATVAKLINIRG
jgi:hypothetical protein